MINSSFQHTMDLIIQKYLLRFLPKWLTSNQLTIIRLVLVPFVYFLLVKGHLIAGFIVFAIAALTDALDGALARTGHTISDFGKLMDPIADKLLIGSVFLYIGFDYLIVKIFLTVVAFEILAVAISALTVRKTGHPTGANVYGKIKMVLQTLAVSTFLFGIFYKNDTLIMVSEWVLFVALFFALVSGMEQIRLKPKRVNFRKNTK